MLSQEVTHLDVAEKTSLKLRDQINQLDNSIPARILLMSGRFGIGFKDKGDPVG